MMKFFVLAASVAATGITAAGVKPTSLVAGAKAVNTITVTVTETLVLGDTVVITYPAGFKLPLASDLTPTATGKTAPTIEIAGQIITLTLTEGSAAGTAVVITLTPKTTGITNPANVGATGTFPIKIVKKDTTAAVTSDFNDAAAVTIIAGECKAGTAVVPADCNCGTEKAVVCIKGGKCTATNTCTQAPPALSACAADTEGATVLTADCKCGTAACKTGGKCNTTTNVCSGAFSYGFTMLAVLAAFVL